MENETVVFYYFINYLVLFVIISFPSKNQTPNQIRRIQKIVKNPNKIPMSQLIIILLNIIKNNTLFANEVCR